jgi:hypothetical protein
MFFGCKPSDLRTGHRYRFAYLDGCQTARVDALIENFGAEQDEIRNGKTLKDLYSTMSGPMTIESYPPSGNKKRRPGLFLGYRTDTIVAIANQTRQLDPTTGCLYYSYDALCNWHQALLGYWQNQVNYDFISAAKRASETTMCANPNSPFPRPDYNQQVDDFEARLPISFLPDECLRVFGFGNLRFNQYNATDSTWP